MDANALALGRVTVQSALGEPLRAEVDIAEVTPDELASLKATIASPEAFRAAGLEYSSALSGVSVTLQQHANGRPYLLLTSTRPVNDPFIDLILETQWASGRIVRDYTMLFDPPQMRQAAPAIAQTAPVAPVTPAAPTRQAPPSAPVARAPVARAPSAAERPAPAAPAAAARGVAPAETGEGAAEKVTVQRGDSAGRIAAAHKPPTISLDQMLVALLQANPQAFIGANVNRLRAGAVLQMPTAEQAAQQTPEQASRTIVAQSRDFNEFHRRLAEGLPAAGVPASERQASGKVQAEVQDKTAAPTGPDKLTLSKGAVQGKSAEDRIARDRQAQDAATRLAELNKNIADLNKLQSSTTAPAPATAAAGKAPTGPAVPAAPLAAAAKASAPAPAPVTTAAAKPATAASATPVTAARPASAPATAAPAATAAVATASAPAAAASAPMVAAAASAPAAASTASAPAASAAKPASAPAAKPAAAVAKKPAPAPMPIEEPSLLDDLLDNPLILAAAGGVVALLAGFGVYRMRQRKKSPQVDSSFLESRLQPDSFFGGSGGQRIDTAEGAGTGSSMVYSPSQLDAAGDVDPVAEADVYLAYGRDLQAEEILKEALRISPHRVAIHSKLLEIYAKRRDAKAFEVAATEAYGLTHGEGLEWEHICELGRDLDATNPLYRPGGAPAEGAAAVIKDTAAAQRELDSPATTSPDLDLDLDFSSGEDSSAGGAREAKAVHLHDAPEVAHDHVEVDFAPAEPPQSAGVIDLPIAEEHVDLPAVEAAAPSAAPAAAASLDEPLSFELPALDEQPQAQPTQSLGAAESAPTAAPAADDNALNFDLEPEPSQAPVSAPAPAAAATTANDKMIEFDLGSLSLDLDSPAAPAKAQPAPAAAAPVAAADDILSTQGLEQDTSGDPLATKFALAQEFNAIGDPDGARSLAEEVIAEASGELKKRAQKFLAEIG